MTRPSTLGRWIVTACALASLAVAPAAAQYSDYFGKNRGAQVLDRSDSPRIDWGDDDGDVGRAVDGDGDAADRGGDADVASATPA